MSTLEELDDLDRREKEEKRRENNDKKATVADEDDEMKDAEDKDDILDEEILSLSTQDIQTRKRLLENDSRIMKSELSRLTHEKAAMGEKIKENMDKIANNRQVSPTSFAKHSAARLVFSSICHVLTPNA
jgi:26S proteasome regulatory subunit T5